MGRETKTIKTPIDKHDVVLKAWITGREKRELRNVFLSKMGLGGKGEMKENPADITDAAENKAIETIVISVNGKTEKIIDAILDMKGPDYEFVIKEINGISKETAFLE